MLPCDGISAHNGVKKMLKFHWKYETKFNLLIFYEKSMFRPVTDVGKNVVPAKDVCKK